MDSHTGTFSIIGGIWFITMGTVIGMWRKVGSFVTKDELKEDLSKEADYRIKVNMDLLQRMTAVETKVNDGFDNFRELIKVKFDALGEKIDKNGGSR